MFHGEMKPHQCQICSRLFSRKGNLNKSVSRIHNKNKNLKQHQCNICQESFSLSENLKRNVQTVHENKKK